MKRFSLLATVVAAVVAAVLVPIQPAAARAADFQLVLPRWAVSSPEPEARHEQRESTRKAALEPAPASRTGSSRSRRPARARRGQARSAQAPSRVRSVDPKVIFAALKLFRVNQRTMVVCDRIAVRRGDEPPSRMRFLLRVDSAGGARVQVDAPRSIRPAVARCYRMLAASWSYPSTGQPYTLRLSRISPTR